jgi:V/A-type H+-transporting ATPase subunit K
MRKKNLLTSAFLLLAGASAFAQTTASTTSVGISGIGKYVGAGIAVGLATLGSGIAVAKIGAAAVGAMVEKPELSGKALPYVGLAEGICLWGFLVALLILVL